MFVSETGNNSRKKTRSWCPGGYHYKVIQLKVRDEQRHDDIGDIF